MEILEKGRAESAKQYIKRVLTHNIVNIALQPGEKIVEKELCQFFQLSRTPIREAILELHKDHLIDIRPKRGTYVSYIDEKRVEEVRQLREVLEGEIAVQACRLLTNEQIDILRENVIVWQYYIEKQQERKIFELDKAFHAMLYTMCGKEYWNEIVQAVAPHFDRTTVLSFRCQPKKHVLMDHKQLIEAIEKKDEQEACAAARRHLHRYHENIDMMKQRFPGYFEK
ncbi:GntR family transcriptional regulator [Megasphaera cerevisiae DSM 20462]|jgi:DNA-binding GntR family transcriptional regulator|uniref:GntR family transcriptional regulator n=1 Tax=Megasphaera cerevisiae DSM 20462 TaxID=1122219 RepID=A0A0J6WYL9_9FIRM|nr:GntR family transcriptional regulator [Megasphaera cerevisiae]KMO87744.1 GntR family transcriptional regulator [Megasphaera cerevisiae DSM 20462]OKY53328.1 GntR family transcriptional regulator [Megasphaera cerevisiae]SJZ63777.1 DNA-binding transcriptional regulator, GntR family [Megasphaera cerevisiae DSM 20462]